MWRTHFCVPPRDFSRRLPDHGRLSGRISASEALHAEVARPGPKSQKRDPDNPRYHDQNRREEQSDDPHVATIKHAEGRARVR